MRCECVLACHERQGRGAGVTCTYANRRGLENWLCASRLGLPALVEGRQLLCDCLMVLVRFDGALQPAQRHASVACVFVEEEVEGAMCVRVGATQYCHCCHGEHGHTSWTAAAGCAAPQSVCPPAGWPPNPSCGVYTCRGTPCLSMLAPCAVRPAALLEPRTGPEPDSRPCASALVSDTALGQAWTTALKSLCTGEQCCTSLRAPQPMRRIRLLASSRLHAEGLACRLCPRGKGSSGGVSARYGRAAPESCAFVPALPADRVRPSSSSAPVVVLLFELDLCKAARLIHVSQTWHWGSRCST